MSSSITSSDETSANMSTRSLSQISEVEAIKLGLDLVPAARRNIGFLKAVAASQWLHQKPTLIEAIRRYNELWMPLISDLTVGSTPPLILPPIDIEWVWFCHTLNPNEEYALMRCKEIWLRRYPDEPFENEVDSDLTNPVVADEEFLMEVTKHRFLYSKFSEPYRSETLYLIAARQRYKGFLYMLQKSIQVRSRLVPASDILLMWLIHQCCEEGGICMETVNKNEVEETKNLWETTLDQPYEKAGGEIDFNLDGVIPVQPPVYWEVSDTDVNTKYKPMQPRFLLEVCVFVRLKVDMKTMHEDRKRDTLRLRMLRCHRELKLDKTISNFSNESWIKAWHLYCEFGTKGVIVEHCRQGGYCCKAIQAPYLLKCVPDRVTDDSGAMISDVILKMNHYHPQEGRWLSRTVLDHAGRECFVIRMRVGGGFWRRGGEVPSAVKWEDRITEIREGSWSYVAGSVGRAPERVVGTATPKEASGQWKAAWQFSTGDELMLRWDSSTSISRLSFCLTNKSESMVKLLKGRKMQYQKKKVKSRGNDSRASRNELEEEEVDEEEEGFLTLVRFTEDNPNGRATALLNWKLLVIEFLPEEDAIFILLLCISILRSVTDMRKEDLGSLLTRRRVKEAKLGSRDWVLWYYTLSLVPQLLLRLTFNLGTRMLKQLWYQIVQITTRAAGFHSHARGRERSAVQNPIPYMALTNFLVILIILLPITLSSSSSSPDSIETLLLKVCDNVYEKDSCITKVQTELSQQSPDRSRHSVINAALKHSLNEARAAIEMITRFNTLSTNYREQVAIGDCQELLDFSVSELASSLGEMKIIRSNPNDIAHHEGNLKAWLSAALSNQDTCLEGFEGTDRRVERFIRGSLRQVTHLIGNVLALYTELHSLPFKPPRDQNYIIPTNQTSGLPSWITDGDEELIKSHPTRTHVNAVVAADGSGNYRTITEAVNAAPNYSNRRYIIYIKKGIYRENIDMKKKKTNIIFVGDGIGKTVVTGDRNFMQGWTTFRTATVAVSGKGFIARDMTFRNTAPPENHQAVALRVDSDQSAFFRCSIEGHQDTLYAHSLRQFYRECDIYGTIDFIFGNGAAVLQNCKIYTRVPLPLQKVTISAQGRKNPHQSTGFSIQDSYILATQPTYLGRPWKQFSRTVFMNTYMSGLVQPRGWLEWYGDFALSTLWYGEYRNYGPGAALSGRVKWPGYHIIKDAGTAYFFTVGRFIDGMTWLPRTGVKFTAGLRN
ncbi:hypothetical protein G4B88_027663 [Cannabis sativa]|uniref:Pectinesterase inhibitor domain-containing protein n=1 Tax=Cannabis sativa TaxID=3483 RepID=A0A7J6DQ24_CANSA|nr:hypothetical protein G4B88_027663 [Cannabis sativa]